MLTHFIQYQKITDLIGKKKLKFLETVKLTMGKLSFQKLQHSLEKQEYYHWHQTLSVVYHEMIGLLHF
jgi:hypothetical protein